MRNEEHEQYVRDIWKEVGDLEDVSIRWDDPPMGIEVRWRELGAAVFIRRTLLDDHETHQIKYLLKRFLRQVKPE